MYRCLTENMYRCTTETMYRCLTEAMYRCTTEAIWVILRLIEAIAITVYLSHIRKMSKCFELI